MNDGPARGKPAAAVQLSSLPLGGEDSVATRAVRSSRIMTTGSMAGGGTVGNGGTYIVSPKKGIRDVHMTADPIASGRAKG